jgi:predicted GNAT family acetyltransferase
VVEAPPITHLRADQRGAFIMERDGRRLGELTYTMTGARITIHHTEVDTALRGTGAARNLVDAAVQWARTENMKIESRCDYASAVFAKTPAAYADVLAG